MSQDELHQAEQAVLSTLQHTHTTSFPQLVDLLRRQGLSERSVRLAAWDLVDRKRLDLTTDYKLTTREST